MGFHDNDHFYDNHNGCGCCAPTPAAVAALLKAQSDLVTMKAFHEEQAKTIKMLTDKNERLNRECVNMTSVIDFLWAKLGK